MKVCRKCDIKKPVTEFTANPKNKDGLVSYCKPCATIHSRQHNKTDKSKFTRRERFLRNRYGITQENYNLLLKTQNYVCAICKKPCSIKNRLSVDHCHQTGKIRGLLCFHCNLALGKFKDSLINLQAAIDYIWSSYTS